MSGRTRDLLGKGEFDPITKEDRIAVQDMIKEQKKQKEEQKEKLKPLVAMLKSTLRCPSMTTYLKA